MATEEQINEILVRLREIEKLQKINLENFYTLPVNDKWRYLSIDIRNITIQPGEKKDIINVSDECGWLVYAHLYSDNPYLTIHARTDDMLLEGSSYYLYSLGLTRPDNVWPYCAMYDTINSIYVLQFSPTNRFPYHHRTHVWVSNDGLTAGTIIVGAALRLAMDYTIPKKM